MRPPGGSSNVRRQPKESAYLPPTPLNSHRDSDVSLASSRSSSIGIHSLDVYKDRSYQQNTTATINSFLASQDLNVSFKPFSSPSAKHIHQTLIFLVGLLDFNINKIEDLPPLLKFMNYPHKLNKSVLKSPAAPHQWPSILALIHWLVQSCQIHLSFSSPSHTTTLQTNNIVFQYSLNAYLNFIRGDDEAISELDHEIRTRILREKSNADNTLAAAEQKVSELEAQLEGLRSAPSQKDLLDKEKEMLQGDVIKFHKIIDEFGLRIESKERDLVEKEKQLQAKVVESDNICQENKMLKKKVESQPFNTRDVERMKRELQAAERDAGEAELARNDWEEKCWELDRTLANNIRDLEPITRDCNQALKRFFSFPLDIDKKDVSLSKFKGKVLLIVNVASRCGLTSSNYTELSHLYENFKDRGLEVLAFPCNQFGMQEPGSNEEIKQFACTKFKAEFPIFDKVDVNGPFTAPVYQFLKSSSGGFFGDLVKWNFEKFLVDKNGKVVERYPPTTSPFQIEVNFPTA
ncbi:unnamed protein product [Vicia faba]|uniref:Multifunctional fusion protein n=1 Tax=Vicia faba TaxID=3906 RepID=A0AAV0YKE5_VICFA|nr:unnamed protein product [Vicia faba]